MLQRCLTIVLSMIVIGCGGRGDAPELGTVAGTVTLDGNALPNATVTFTPLGENGGRPSSGVTDMNGRYELKYSNADAGALLGKHRVEITTATTTTDDDGNDVDVPEKLPAKYNAETKLEKKVEPGSNTIDFPLDSKGKIHNEKDDEKRERRSEDC